MIPALVIGGGPAGLMAADALLSAGVPVLLAEAKPSVARKLLMAGKSGLNLTKDEPEDAFLRAYGEAAPALAPMLAEFGPRAVRRAGRAKLCRQHRPGVSQGNEGLAAAAHLAGAADIDGADVAHPLAMDRLGRAGGLELRHA